MTKQFRSIAFAACIATLATIGMPTARAKQQCNAAAMPSNSHKYWSWRLIDGRQCWYEGKPMLSKSSSEWPARGSAKPHSNRESESVLTEMPNYLLYLNAWAPDSDSFEVRWRAIMGRNETWGPRRHRVETPGLAAMTDQQLALQAVSEAQRILEKYLQPRPNDNERAPRQAGRGSGTPRFDG